MTGEFRGRIYDSVLDTIGATPLVRLHRLAAEAGARADILGKCEFFNPLSSVKDRIGLAMIEAAEPRARSGPAPCWSSRPRATPASRSPSSAAAKGYRLILTMPDSMSVERRKMLLLLGAELELTPAARGMRGAIARAEEIVRQTARRRHAAAVPEPGQPRDSSPHHRRGDLERHRRRGRYRRQRGRHRRHADRRRLGAEAAQAGPHHGRGRAGGQRGPLGRPARPAQDPGHRRRVCSRNPRHHTDRRGHADRQRHRVAHGARAARLEGWRSASPPARRWQRRSKSAPGPAWTARRSS